MSENYDGKHMITQKTFFLTQTLAFLLLLLSFFIFNPKLARAQEGYSSVHEYMSQNINRGETQTLTKNMKNDITKKQIAGTVVEVNSSDLILKTKNGIETYTVLITSDIEKNGEEISLVNLKAHDEVILNITSEKLVTALKVTSSASRIPFLN